MKKIFLFTMVALLFAGCAKKGNVYEEYYSFDNGLWERFQKLDFEIPVEKPGKLYDIIMVLEYDVNFPEDKIPFHIIMEMPNGEERIKEYHPRIRSHKGSIYGKIEDGKATQEVVLRTKHAFTEVGNAKINIECFYPKYTINGIYSVGIVMRRSEKE